MLLCLWGRPNQGASKKQDEFPVDKVCVCVCVWVNRMEKGKKSIAAGHSMISYEEK